MNALSDLDLDWEPDPDDPDDAMPLIADKVNGGDQVRLEGDSQIYYAALYMSRRGGREQLILHSIKRHLVVDSDDIRLRIVRRVDEPWKVTGDLDYSFKVFYYEVYYK